MHVYEVVYLDEEPFKGIRKLVQGNTVGDALNTTNKKVVYLLVDHEKKKIWKCFGPESSTILKMHAITLAYMLNSRLQLSYDILDIGESSKVYPNFQDLLEKKLEKKVSGTLDETIVKISESLAKSK